MSECRICNNERSRKTYAKLTTEQKKDLVKNRRYYNREYKLKRNYGLTVEEYERMFIDQENQCHLCDRPFDETAPYVDHDHETGKVRKLLCRNCNTILGVVKENTDTLLKMIAYIEDHK